MNNEHLPISRRRLLAGTSAVAAAGLLDAFPSPTAFAKAPMLNTQAPHFYRFKLGSFEGTIVSDGTLPLGKPEDNFVGLTKPEMGKQLTDNFLPLENMVLEQNALVINTGDKLVLFDTGMGGLKLFGPTTRQAVEQHETGWDRPEGYRRRGDEPCAHRPLRRLHGGRRIPPFSERTVLHYPGRLRLLDH